MPRSRSRTRSRSRKSSKSASRRRMGSPSWYEKATGYIPSGKDAKEYGWAQWQKVPEVKAPEGYVNVQAVIDKGRKLRRDFVQDMLNANPLVVAGVSLGAMSALVAVMGIRKYWPEIKAAYLRAKSKIHEKEFREARTAARRSVSKSSKKRRHTR